MALDRVTLEDKYDLGESRIFVTGFQALVRLCMMQKERDRRAGLTPRGMSRATAARRWARSISSSSGRSATSIATTSGFQPWHQRRTSPPRAVGSQQAKLRGGRAKFDGVFGLWYGKGPGVNHTRDVFRHANFAGAS